jgi:hypothetical protein
MSATRRVQTLLLLPISVLLVAHSLIYDFVSDDAYISFVYSRNLAEHGQLVFNLGERVEGYTNFLWTVLLGGLMKLGIAPEISSRILGTAFGVATLYVVFRLTEKLRGAPSWWDLFAPTLLAISSGYACWCTGGLETQMFTFFCTLGMLWLYGGERPIASGIAFALAALTRPEGALVAAVAAGIWLVWDLGSRRALLPRAAHWLWGAVFVGIVAPYFAWRWWYYGWPFPNTFYVKAGGEPSPAYSKAMLEHGLYFVWQWAWQSKAVFAAPFVLAGAFFHRRFGTFVLALTAVYLVYTVKVGGDFMGLHRFVMPLFVTTAVMMALGCERLVGLASVPWFVSLVPAVAIAGLFAWAQHSLDKESVIPKADNGIDRPGYLKVYADDRELIGRALAPHMHDDDFSIVGGVGVQPYWARMRAIDVFGLVSEDIAHNEPPTNPRPGHQKWATAQRLLGYHPTFIFHCYDLHTDPDKYHLCPDAPTFLASGYEPVTMYVQGLKERGEYYTFLKRKDRVWP